MWYKNNIQVFVLQNDSFNLHNQKLKYTPFHFLKTRKVGSVRKLLFCDSLKLPICWELVWLKNCSEWLIVNTLNCKAGNVVFDHLNKIMQHQQEPGHIELINNWDSPPVLFTTKVCIRIHFVERFFKNRYFPRFVINFLFSIELNVHNFLKHEIKCF